jgi:DNA-binding MarR family transcriptional regulator
MPLVADSGGSLAYLVDVSGLDPATVSDALDRLVTLNLVDSQGNLSERRYSIHGLTRTFLQEQVGKWQ